MTGNLVTLTLGGVIRRIILLVGVLLLLAAPASAAVEETAVMPRVYKNCTELNKKYPHGLGRANAVDKTSGEPVTAFKRNTRLYRIAMSYNRRLDRDKDGIACEKL